MHLTHTDLYVAVENWLLLCAVMFTATAVLLITVTTSELPTSEEVGFLIHRGDLHPFAEGCRGFLSNRRVFGRFQPYLQSSLECVPRGVHVPVND